MRILPDLKTLGVAAGVAALGCLMMSTLLLWRQGIWAILATAATAAVVVTIFTVLTIEAGLRFLGLRLQDKELLLKHEPTEHRYQQSGEETGNDANTDQKH